MSQFIAHIENGRITNKPVVRDAFQSLSDGAYKVKIETLRKRTCSQNSYYWSCIVPIVKDGLRDAGFDEVRTNDDAHLVMKALFLKRHFVNPATGEAIEWIESTTKLSTVQFNEFIENVYKWASSYLSIYIPAPGEQTQIF